MTKRVLVTGGGGFVGANLVRRLLKDGHDVHLLLKAGRGYRRLTELRAAVAIHVGDLRDRNAVNSTMHQVRPDWVFHLGVYGAYPSQYDVAQILSTNIQGTAALLDAAASIGVEMFVNTGSSSEYGAKDHPPSETEAINPNSVYAVSKAAATMYCALRGGDLPVATLRLYSVYGAMEEPTRFIPQLVARGLDHQLPPLADPGTARDYVYIDDVVAAYLAVTQARFESGAVFNIGTGRQTTLAQAVETARSVFGIEAEPVWNSMEDRSWDTGIWVANPTKAQEELDWISLIDFEQGLGLTAESWT